MLNTHIKLEDLTEENVSTLLGIVGASGINASYREDLTLNWLNREVQPIWRGGVEFRLDGGQQKIRFGIDGAGCLRAELVPNGFKGNASKDALRLFYDGIEQAFGEQDPAVRRIYRPE